LKGRRTLENNNSNHRNNNKWSGKQASLVVSEDSNQSGNGCPIVGIGSFASSLQTLLQLFESMSGTTGMAFVIIQQLDVKQEGALVTRLSKVTDMQVNEVDENVAVLPNQIYVAAPGTELTLARGVLTALPQNNQVRQYTPIDSFLVSLAQDKGDKALGVILSGNGSDGFLGLKEINAVGGITIAQASQLTEGDSISLNSSATSLVNFVLAPQEIAEKLAVIVQSSTFTSSTAEGELFSNEANALGRILSLLHKASGINFVEYKQITIKRRIARRMILQRIDKLNDYITYLRQNRAELDALQQDMLINVTRFFREPQAFNTLKNLVFPSIVNSTSPNSSIRLWVPGCSTGEEAYSLAIALQEFLEDHALNRQIQIFATDINETVIDKARSGIYPENIVADVSPDRLSRFFVEVAQGYQVSKAIRDVCVFAKQDMSKDPPISRVDLVSCRNVMIYFGPALQKKMFPIFHYALNSRGFLFLGASESIGVFADLFSLLDKKYRVYEKKAVTTPMIFEFFASEQAAAVSHPIQKDDLGILNSNYWLDVQKQADAIVVNKYAPPGVIINSKLDILQFRGRTGVYLEPAPGMPSVNLLKMAREGLLLGLRAAVSQAKKENILVRKEGLHVINNGHSFLVNVDVVPIKGRFEQGEYFLILFRDSVAQHLPNSKLDSDFLPLEGVCQPGQSDKVLHLKQELAAKEEYLQSIIDQHEAANENLRYANEKIQSSNEELQSMNEEMETAKEELQSTNEELMTLNEELQNRNLELSDVNNDVYNLLRSIDIPVLILSSDFRIRRFNSVAEKVLNLISADVGRPINNIRPNIDIPDLEQASLEVIETLVNKELEVQDRWGHWYSMQIRPYKTTDNKIDGVIITLVDIHTLKNSFDDAQEACEYAEAIVETVRQPLLVLDADLRLKTANKAYYQAFQMTPGEIKDQSIFQMKDGQWDIAELHTLLEDLLTHDTAFENFEVNYNFPNVGKQKMLVNACRIVNEHNKTKLILLAFEMNARAVGKL
jgi:two-component system CheB/CheR fusion protein